MTPVCGNPFYSNAEAYAFEILQQRLIKEAQKSMQQNVLELSALKALFNQGQFIYCIPIGGVNLPIQTPQFFGPVPPPDLPFAPPDPHHNLPHPPPNPCTQPPSIQPPCAPSPAILPLPPPSPPHPTHHHPLPNHQSVLNVNLKNGQNKTTNIKQGSDECNIGDVGIELSINLREYMPAEVSLDVDEKYLEIKACHVDAHGSKTFARRYDLPACIILDTVKCILSHDGYLLFSAAWVKME